jgi:hypothetical protein
MHRREGAASGTSTRACDVVSRSVKMTTEREETYSEAVEPVVDEVVEAQLGFDLKRAGTRAEELPGEPLRYLALHRQLDRLHPLRP